MNSRREFIGRLGVAAGGFAVLSATSGGCAQKPVNSPDQPVWLGMTQQELNDAYDQSVYASNIPEFFERLGARSAASLQRLGKPEAYRYSDTPGGNLVVFGVANAGAPVHVFIHGGTWRFGSADLYYSIAENVVNAGASAVLLNFASVSEDAVPLGFLAGQIRDAVKWIYLNADRFGGDPEQIYVSGHSSGGHLAGVALTTDWPGDYQLPADVIKGGVCCSGMFDLAPVRLSSRNDWLQLTDDEVRALSPQRHIEHLNAPLIVAYGTSETPEFQRQSRDFAAAVKASGKPVELVVAEGYNHFEIVESCTDAQGVIGRVLLAQMGLA